MAANSKAAPRRQARGEARIALILHSAARTFADRGYSAASTNHIAKAAGISPGSLYQYFPNKEAIAVALVQRYSSDIVAAHDASLSSIEVDTAPLAEVIHAIVGPLDEYRKAHGEFIDLFLSPRLPDELIAPVAAAERRIESLIASILHRRNSSVDDDSTGLAANVAITLFRGYMSRAGHTAIPLLEVETALDAYLRSKDLH